jgi:hypothetical protein
MAVVIATIGSAEVLQEWSVTLDEDDIRPFFDRLTSVIDAGFGTVERDEMAKLIASLKAGDEGARRFPVKFDGSTAPLRIRAVMGSHRAARIEFSTSPELADRIRKEGNIFLDELDR